MKFLYVLLAAAVLFSGCVSEEQPYPEENQTVVVNDTTADNITAQENVTLDINSFEECIDAGYPVLESYPRQCRTPDGKMFVSLHDLFDSALDRNCSSDEDCMLANREHAFSCCWEGACDAIDYSEDKWKAVSREWFEGVRADACPSEEECGPAPACAVRAVNESFAARCTAGQCTKVPLSEAEITISEQDNETRRKEGLSFANGSYILVFDDAVLPAYDGLCGSFSIVEAENYSILHQFVKCPSGSEMWTSPEGHEYRIRVLEVAAGYTGEKWAEAIIFG